jgi:hypothetical protein
MVVDPPAERPVRRRAVTRDAVCVAAVDLARAAAEEAAEPGTVGEHLGTVAEADRVVTHRFASTARGYRGWTWTVPVARALRARAATVSEIALLPGGDAVLAPEWVPWQDRLTPADVGAADVLPYTADDDRLEPGYAATGDEDADRVAIWELGLGRPRVLSPHGRADAAQRWYTGDHGPQAEQAKAAAAPCRTCGFFLQLSGSLRQVFGVCTNEWSPSDGQVVSLDHGCGAHSETDVQRRAEAVAPPIVDETGYDELVVR